MVKRSVLFAVLLSSCAPLLAIGQGTKSTLTKGPANTLVFVEGDGVLAERVLIALDGPTKVIWEGCGERRDEIVVCRVGNVAAKGTLTLKYEGTLRGANASFFSAGVHKGVVTP